MSTLAISKIEEIIKTMLYAMKGNDDFLKLIYIDRRSALQEGTPLIDYEDLMKIPYFRSEIETLTEQAVKLRYLHIFLI